jgi:hypothetical protein
MQSIFPHAEDAIDLKTRTNGKKKKKKRRREDAPLRPRLFFLSLSLSLSIIARGALCACKCACVCARSRFVRVLCAVSFSEEEGRFFQRIDPTLLSERSAFSHVFEKKTSEHRARQPVWV